jgi:hypothetical protein
MDNMTLLAAFRGEPVRSQEVFDEALMGGAGI